MVTSPPPLPLRAALYARNVTLKALRQFGRRTITARKRAYFRIRGTRVGRRLIGGFDFARAPREVTARRRAAAAFNLRVPAKVMDPVTGYRILPADYFPEIGAALATARQLFERKVSRLAAQTADVDQRTWTAEKRAKFLAEKTRFLRNLLTSDDLRDHPALVDFALSDAALGVATDYLQMVPYLCRVDLLYSVPRESDDKIASQLFHVDPEGLTQVKFFINVFDIGEPEGPFTFIPADESERILKEIRALRRRLGKEHVGRYLDSEIEAVGGTGSIVSITGPQGAGVAIDTSRCLHLGSRVQPGAFRLVLYVQYCTTPEPSNVFDVERYKADPIRHMAVAHSLASAGTAVMAPHQMNT